MALTAGGDQLLVARLGAGDDDAVGEVFDRHAPFLLGVALRVTLRRDLAEDVVQEVITHLWTDPGAFDPARGSLRAYLGVQARRRAIDAVRGDERRRHREAREHEMARITVSATIPVSADVVRSAIERLPVDQRAVVELAYWHGRTLREIAGILAIPEGTAKSRLRLAHAKLARWLAALREEMM